MDLEKLSDEEFNAIVDYALSIYKISAEESLFENNEEQYQQLMDISSDNDYSFEVAVETTDAYFDEEDVGEGEVVAVSLNYKATAESLKNDETVAKVYFTVSGMDDMKGVVEWFPNA